MISGLQPQPAEVLDSTGFLDKIGRQNIFARTGPAIDTAIANMDLDMCSTCPYFAFRECADLKRQGVLESVDTREGVL